MSQLKNGTVTVATGSNAVVGVGTTFSQSANGSLFTIQGSSVPYFKAGHTSDTAMTLTANYAGAGASGQFYALTTSYTPALSLPYMEKGDIETHTIFKAAMVKLDALLGGALGGTLVAGAILFGGTAGAIASDSTNFSWDATNKSVLLKGHVGSSPVAGQAQLGGSASAGAVVRGQGTTNDVSLMSRAGSIAVAIVANSQRVLLSGATDDGTTAVQVLGNTKMTGNLGFTSSSQAWASSRRAIDFGGGHSLNGDGSSFIAMGSNFYLDSGASLRYTTTAAVASLVVSPGAMTFYTAPSGTAGTVPSLTAILVAGASGVTVGSNSNATTKFTLNTASASGNGSWIEFQKAGSYHLQWGPQSAILGGTASNDMVWYMSAANDYKFYSAGTLALQIAQSVATYNGAVVTYNGGTNSLSIAASAGSHTYIQSSPTGTILPLRIYMQGTNTATFGAAGSFTVNTGHLIIPASSGFYLDGGGDTYITEQSANTVGIITGGGTRVTIGTASLSFALPGTWISGAGSVVATIQNTSTTGPAVRMYHDIDSNSGSRNFLTCDAAASVERFGITTNGGVRNYQANNLNLSDARVKPSIQLLYATGLIPDLWSAHKAMRHVWCRFKYGDQTHTDWNYGNTAQGVAAAFSLTAPELVDDYGASGFLGVYENDLKNITGAIVTEAQIRIDHVLEFLRSKFPGEFTYTPA